MKHTIMKRILALTLLLSVCAAMATAARDKASEALLRRICPEAAGRIMLEIGPHADGNDYFEISSRNGKPRIVGNNSVSVATGLHWYMKNHCGVHLSWNNMQAQLPAILPLPSQTIRKQTPLTMRYDFNYCTFSYSMAFWDWDRWEKEIDWMALHGINMPLAIVGMESAWRNMLLRLGYTEQEVGDFIAGPAFLAWWAMNNLEGWGGPLPPRGMRTARNSRKRSSPA